MRKAAAESWPDGRFMAFVPEMEQTGEGVDDPTPELEAAPGEARDALASLSNEESDEPDT
jgi:hypothetical protein